MKKFYWLFATPLLASPECCTSEQDVYDVANRLLKNNNKLGHVLFLTANKVGDETHYDYRLIIEN